MSPPLSVPGSRDTQNSGKVPDGQQATFPMHWVGLMAQVSVVDEHQDHSVKLQRGRERKRLMGRSRGQAPDRVTRI